MLTVPGLGRFTASRSTAGGARLMERRASPTRALVTRQRIEHALAIAAQPGNGAFLLRDGEIYGHPDAASNRSGDGTSSTPPRAIRARP